MKKAAGKDSKKKDKKKKNKVKEAVSGQDEDSSSGEDYESSEESQVKVKECCPNKKREGGKRIRVTGRGSLVKVSRVTEDTPCIRGRGMASKGSRKGRKIKILPNSGATMTLCHAKVAMRLGLKISKKDKDIYELVDAQGQQVEVLGT